jgi:hypothetical protein
VCSVISLFDSSYRNHHSRKRSKQNGIDWFVTVSKKRYSCTAALLHNPSGEDKVVGKLDEPNQHQSASRLSHCLLQRIAIYTIRHWTVCRDTVSWTSLVITRCRLFFKYPI